MDTDPSYWIYTIVLVLLLFLSMSFSSGETAFIAVDKLRIKYLREKKNKKAARVEKILKNKQNFLTTSLIGNSLVNILISVILTALMVRLVGDSGLSIAVGVATIAILIFGEIIPKSVALVFSESIALRFSGFVLILMKILSPIVWVLNGFTKVLLKLGGVKNLNSDVAMTDADLKDFFDLSHEGGQLATAEREVLEKILDYGDVTVKNIMTPRPEVISLQFDLSAKEIIDISKDSRFSRFPVYKEDIDEIEGIFYIKDFLYSKDREFLQSNADKFDIKKYLRKPVFVFENTELSKLQEMFKNEKQNMFIVIDEYGGTLGIVTVEDLHEEIFGNIADEYDTDEAAQDEPNLEVMTEEESNEEQSYIISGSVRLSDINEDLGTSFKSEYYDTIGGLIMEKQGEVPQEGAIVEIENYVFTVIKTEGHKIVDIEITASGEEE